MMHSTAHGVLAPNAKLHREIVPSPLEPATEPSCDHAHAQGTAARMSWGRLLKRAFDIASDRCPNCGGALKIIASIEDPENLQPSRPDHAQRFDLFQTKEMAGVRLAQV